VKPAEQNKWAFSLGKNISKMDELQELIDKQKSLESEIQGLEEKKQSLSREVSDYEEQKKGLEDAVTSLKYKLDETRERIKEVREQDKSRFDAYKMAKVGEVISKLSNSLSSLTNEDVKKQVLETWQERYANDSLDEGELENQLLLSYMSLKPQELKELLNVRKVTEATKQEFVQTSKNLSSQTTEEIETSEITQEDRIKAVQLGVSPETIAKIRKGEQKSTLLKGNEPVLEY
jgi:FtsZ-binding cell division protein ZapB